MTKTICPRCKGSGHIDQAPWLPPHRNRPAVSEIITIVCMYHGIRVDDLVGQRRFADLVIPRQVAMYLAYLSSGRSLANIGEAIGGRDHSTVLHGVRCVKKRMSEDPVFSDYVREVKALLADVATPQSWQAREDEDRARSLHT